MYRNRLDIQIDVLRKIIEENRPFNMNVPWVKSSREPCGTVCCALGAAALDPRLQAKGLHLRLHHSFDKHRVVKTVEEFVKRPKWQQAVYVNYKSYTNFEAGAKFYGISYVASQMLFDPNTYSFTATPSDVIARIMELYDAHWVNN